MTTLDSKEVFRTRANVVGLSPATLAALMNYNVDTLSRLQFASAYQLGQADDRPLIAVAEAALGSAPSPADATAIRRLFFEAATLTMSELKSNLERHDDMPAKKIPQPERVARYRDQVARLPGLRLTGELECSNALIDAVFQQAEDETIRYLSPAKCGRRSQELLGLPKETYLVPDPSGFVKQKSTETAALADLSTEMRTRSALARRSLAYDQCGLCDYHIMDGWIEFLWAQTMRPQVQGYASVSLEQILHADRALFLVLSELTRDGISVRPDGSKPIETAFPRARMDPQVAMLLQPLPSGTKRPFVPEVAAAVRQPGVPSAPGQGKKTLARAAAKMRAYQTPRPPPPVKAPGAPQGGKGKGGKGAKGVPPALAGMALVTPAGEPICFRFNMDGGCPLGSACTRKNVCCMPGCFSAAHGLLNHV